jgi:hypothetical protein
LASSDVEPVVSKEVQNPDYPEDEYPTQQDGILSVVLTTYCALSWHLGSPKMEAEDCYADPGERRENNTHNQQGMNFAPPLVISLLDRIEERSAQRFQKRAVTRLLESNEEARTRLLCCDRLELGHHSTAVA